MNKPNLITVNPLDGVLRKKTIIKSIYGQIELEEYEKHDDELYKLSLTLKDLKPEIAKEFIRIIKPLFEDPINPQLTLFANKKEEAINEN